MRNFDRENMEESMIKNLGDYLNDPETKPYLESEKVKSVSISCSCFYVRLG